MAQARTYDMSCTVSARYACSSRIDIMLGKYDACWVKPALDVIGYAVIIHGPEDWPASLADSF